VNLARARELAARHRWRIAAGVVVLAVLVAGKQYYRDATAADLRWILAPTAKLVSVVSGGNFVYEAGPGYVDPTIGFIIAPPCAGVNFALAAFLALALGGLAGMTTWRATARRLVLAAGLAYVATLLVNTLRIAIAIAMRRGTIDIGGWDKHELHRIEGIVIYLGGLCALYAIAVAIEAKRKLYWMAVPVAAYLVITLVMPLANGAAARRDFAHHAVWVLGACAVVVAVMAIGGRTKLMWRKQ
jgi:exosortase K